MDSSKKQITNTNEKFLKKLFDELCSYASTNRFSKERVQEAYEVAKKAHNGQTRSSGEPYISHPLQVAVYLAQYGADETTIIAALLHDTVEDTDLKLSSIKKQFGDDVSVIIDGLTKIGKNRFREAVTKDRKIESLRKWFQSIHKDVRIAVIKLFDRLHNMQTLEGHKNPEKIYRIAKETLDVYVKIANKLGMTIIKNQLEELCIKHIDPQNYEVLKNIQKQEHDATHNSLKDIKENLKKIDQKESISMVKAQTMPIHKMYQQEIHHKQKPEAVLPLVYTVITPNLESCYQALYLIHLIWKAEQSATRDFINSPQANGYKALHTTVFFKEGRKIRFEIRTEQMEKYYQFGIMRYCFTGIKSGEILFEWYKNLFHVTKIEKEHSENFWNQLQHDILEESIRVQTEKQDQLTLPPHSSVLDAAFYAYGREAYKLQKAYIDGVEVPLNKRVHQYNNLSFDFSDSSTLQYEWLQKIDTALAKEMVREGLQKIDKHKKRAFGKSLLEEKLSEEGKGFIEEADPQVVQSILKEYHLKKIETLYERIAESKIKPEYIAELFYKNNSNTSQHTIQKSIYVHGSRNHIDSFLHQIPEGTKRLIDYTLTTRRSKCSLKMHVYNVPQAQWDILNTIISRAEGLDVNVAHIYYLQHSWIYITCLILLIGCEPFMAKLLLQNASISPDTLLGIRTISSFFFFGIFYFFENHFIQNKTKSLKVFNWRLMLIAASLYVSVYFGYLTIHTASASDYTVLLGIVLACFYAIKSRKLKHIANTHFGISITLLCLTLFMLLSQNIWNSNAKTMALTTVLSFFTFLYSSNSYQKKEKISIRYMNYTFIIISYTALISTLTLFYKGLPNIQTNTLILSIAYSMTFTVIPYYIYSILLQKYKKIHYTHLFIVSFIFVPLALEITFFNAIPLYQKMLAYIAFIGGTAIIASHSHHKNNIS